MPDPKRLYERVHPRFGTIQIEESGQGLTIRINGDAVWSLEQGAPHSERSALESYFLASLFIDRLYQIGLSALDRLSARLTEEAAAEPLVSRRKALTLLRDAVNLVANAK